MTDSRRLVFPALISAGILWGTTVPLSKLALGWLPPAWLAFTRFALAAGILMIISRGRIRGAASPAILVSGVLGFGASVVLQNLGVERTSVSHAALLIGATPVLVAILAAAFRQGVARPAAWAGFGLSLAGVAVIASGRGGGASLGGDGLVLLAQLGSAGFTVSQARLLRGRDPLAVTAVQLLAAATVTLPLALTSEGLHVGHATPAALLATVGLIVAGTVGPTTLFAFGQSHVSADVAGAFLNLEPLVGAITGIVLFGDPFGLAQLAGGAAILTGIALTSLQVVRAERQLRASAAGRPATAPALAPLGVPQRGARPEGASTGARIAASSGGLARSLRSRCMPFADQRQGGTQLFRTRWAAPVIAAVATTAIAATGSAASAVAVHVTRPGLRVVHATRLTRAGALSVFAEAPNGAVYYSAGGTVYVVNGNAAPVPATALGTPVIALAANNTDFFVQTGLTVYEYSRKTDAYAGRTWKLSSPRKPVTSAGLLASGGTLWSWTDWATDQSGFEYATVSEITTSSTRVKVISKGNAYPADIAADASGLYFQIVRSNGANGYIVRVSPDGSVRRHSDVNIGVPAALAGGRLDLLAVHGNGRTYLDSFSGSSLAALGSRQVSGHDHGIAGSTAGLLVLNQPCATLICKNATISVLDPSSGRVSGTVTVAGAFGLLPGPAPAVITAVGTRLYLTRLGG